MSTPFFGISWSPAKPDIEVARSLLAYMGGRRVLLTGHVYSGPWDIPRIEGSIKEMRVFLTQLLCAGGIGDTMSESLELMRSTCLSYLDALEEYSDFDATHPLDGMMVGRSREDDPELASRLDDRQMADEDFEARTALFRGTMRKLLHEVAEAFSLNGGRWTW